jgi:F-type H+-transporting ATPase subunit gamma
MAKTQDLKRRIRSVRNTMQLTKAMKMVAASKLRRSQERILRARPYAERMLRVLRSLAARADTDEHRLLQSHGDSRIELAVLTADKGLCGAFNAGIIRTAEAFAREQAGKQVKINAIGKKGRDYFARRYETSRQWIDVFRRVEPAKAKEIGADLIRRYLAEEVDEIHLVYNEFKSAIQCRPVVQRLLPIEPAELESAEDAGDYLYEPEAAEIFAALLPQYVENQIFRAMLESAAAEHAARMTAMDSATKNAGELIESLTLTMNRVRQSSITTEIIEVVSGAEALGG